MNDESLKLSGPCPKKWAELEGEGPRRFCSECSLHVHDSSALTRAEAEEIARGEGRSCMRLVLDDQGSPLFADSPRRALRWMLAAGAGLLAACPSGAPEGEGTRSTDPVPNTVENGPGETLGCEMEAIGEVEAMGEVVATELVGRVALPEPELMGDVAYFDPELESPEEPSQDRNEGGTDR